MNIFIKNLMSKRSTENLFGLSSKTVFTCFRATIPLKRTKISSTNFMELS